jgi:hypothetical protein
MLSWFVSLVKRNKTEVKNNLTFAVTEGDVFANQVMNNRHVLGYSIVS